MPAIVARLNPIGGDSLPQYRVCDAGNTTFADAKAGSQPGTTYGDTHALKRAAVRGWLVTAIGQALNSAIQVGGTAVIARILTPRDYGLVAMVTAFLGIATVFKDLGLSQATIQREQISHAQVSGLFWLNVAAGCLLMIIIAAAAPLAAWFYGRPEITWIALAYAAMAPISSFGAQHSALLQRRFKYASLALRAIISGFFGVIAGIAAALLGLGYWSIVIMAGVSDIAGTATLWWMSEWIPGPPRWTKELAPLLRFGSALTLSNVMGFLMNGFDSLALGFYAGPVSLGLYTRAQGILARPVQQILPPVITVGYSILSRAKSDKCVFANAITVLLFIGAFASGLVVIPFIVCTDWIVSLVLGPQWATTVSIVRILAIFVLVEPIGSILGMVLVAKDFPGKLARWRIFSGGIIAVGIFAGIPWGAIGVATAYAFSGLFIRTPLFIWYCTRYIGITFSHIVGAVFPCICASLITALIFLILRHSFWSPSNITLSIILYTITSESTFMIILCSVHSSRGFLKQAFALIRVGLSMKPKFPGALP